MYLGSERCILGVKDVFDFVKLKISCNYCSAKLYTNLFTWKPAEGV